MPSFVASALARGVGRAEYVVGGDVSGELDKAVILSTSPGPALSFAGVDGVFGRSLMPLDGRRSVVCHSLASPILGP